MQKVPALGADVLLCPRAALTVLSAAQNNRKSPGKDINVTGVWERNVTGRGVTVVVVDDGVEHTIKDIQPNYVSAGAVGVRDRQAAGCGDTLVVAAGP